MMAQIGKNIAQLRRQRGITQEQLANAIGVSAPAVSKWESGKAYPDVMLLEPIARFLGTNLNDLFGFIANISATELEDYQGRLRELLKETQLEKAKAYISETIRRYPKEPQLLFCTGSELYQACYLFDEETKVDLLRSAAGYLEQASNYAEGNLRWNCLTILGHLYLSLREDGKLETILSTASEKENWAKSLRIRLLLEQEKIPEATAMLQSRMLESISELREWLEQLLYSCAKTKRAEDIACVFNTICVLKSAFGLEHELCYDLFRVLNYDDQAQAADYCQQVVQALSCPAAQSQKKRERFFGGAFASEDVAHMKSVGIQLLLRLPAVARRENALLKEKLERLLICEN